MGLPPKRASGFPGKRVDPNLAGITPIIFTRQLPLNYKVGKTNSLKTVASNSFTPNFLVEDIKKTFSQ